MKLKYKKIIVMVTMCTMGIGLVTFSVSRPSQKDTTAVVENSGDVVTFNTEDDTTLEDQSRLSFAADVTEEPLPTLAPEPTVAVVEEADELEKDAYKDINKLIKKYLKAKLSDDIADFKPLVNDVSIIDMEDVERKTKYIEDYENVTCYTRKGPEEGSYIVYAYHEVKFTSIETLAPGMNEFYVKSDENGDPYIYLGEIDKETSQYFDEVRDSDEVMELIYSVNEKLQKAVDNDGALSEFYLKLEESAQNVTMNDQDN
jgi:hypothetical protein